VPRDSSKKVVLVAAAANVAIASCKYLAAALTRSPSMFAEAFHSTADSGNELLLLLGMKRSARPPDSLHPFGHGKALYFYSLLVAVYIFLIGGAVAVFEGLSHLRHPVLTGDPKWNYVVLMLATGFELYSWRISYLELWSRKDPEESLWDEIVGSKDLTVFTVFLEDSAALLGNFTAFLGIWLGEFFHNPYLDPVASILIGLLLAVVAALLGRESGALLLGERTHRSTIKRARRIIQSDTAVWEVGDLLTMQLGPEQVLLAVDIKFRRDLDVEQLEAAIDRIEINIRRQEPAVARIYLEADSLKKNRQRPSNAA
jgi:cation diffusion facilitator family transporter